MVLFRRASPTIIALLAGCGAGKASEPTIVSVPVVDAAAPIASSRPVVDASAEPAAVATATPELPECETKRCQGDVTKELEAALATRARKAHRCYDTALAKNPSLQGKVMLEVRISEDGSTCRSRIGQSSLGDAVVAECVAAAFKEPGFPAPKRGCVDANIPIQFKPKP